MTHQKQQETGIRSPRRHVTHGDKSSKKTPSLMKRGSKTQPSSPVSQPGPPHSVDRKAVQSTDRKLLKRQIIGLQRDIPSDLGIPTQTLMKEIYHAKHRDASKPCLRCAPGRQLPLQAETRRRREAVGPDTAPHHHRAQRRVTRGRNPLVFFILLFWFSPRLLGYVGF